VAIGWRQFNSVLSSFRQAGYAHSEDAGRTWRFPGLLENDVFRSDPVLAADASGRFYYLSLRDTFYDDYWRSLDGGAQWTRLGFATGGDKQWLAIDRTFGPGRGFSYQYWSTAGNNYGGRQFSRSTNGVTWMDPIFIPGRPIWGTLDVARNGDLLLAGLASPYRFARSRNAQNRFVTPTFDRVSNFDLGGSIIYGAFLNPVGLAGQLWLAVDKSNGPFADRIYVLASVGVNADNPCEVHVVRSSDGGATWSAPKRVHDDPRGAGVFHWFGTLSVAPNGRVDACWYANLRDPSAPDSALFYSASHNGGQTWSPARQISEYFDPTIGFPVQQKIGDYIAMTSDDSGANIAYAATFNGEEDIWFVRVQDAQAVKPYAVRMVEGTSATGTVQDVWDIDTRAFEIVAATGVRTIGATLEADFSVPSTPETLRLNLRSRVSQTPATTSLFFLNVRTGRFDLAATFPSSTAFSEQSAVLPGPVADYLGAERRVQVRVRTITPGRVRPGQAPVQVTDWLSLESG
jgi:hypothetical protein